jgi:hypothetical protein
MTEISRFENAMTTKRCECEYETGMQTLELIELLKAQSKEIAAEGHDGWGNTMTEAASALETICADHVAGDGMKVTDAMVEAACAAFYVNGWPRYRDEMGDDAQRTRMRGALEAALSPKAAPSGDAPAKGSDQHTGQMIAARAVISGVIIPPSGGKK